MVLTTVVLVWKMDSFQGGGAGAAGRSCPSDDAPALASVGPARLAGWWTVGRDDVVADIFLFEDTADAKQYLNLAASPDCRSKASQRPALFPPGVHNLEWSNPYSYAQQDVYLQRGPRVYRVSVVQPGVRSTVGAAMRLQGFHLVNELACELPGAGCGSGVEGYAL